MSSDKMNACADMVLTNAIEDMAMEENISIDEARNKLLDSDACKCLYDFDSKLWMEGSDYFLDFYRMIENKQHISQIDRENRLERRVIRMKAYDEAMYWMRNDLPVSDVARPSERVETV